MYTCSMLSELDHMAWSSGKYDNVDIDVFLDEIDNEDIFIEYNKWNDTIAEIMVETVFSYDK